MTSWAILVDIGGTWIRVAALSVAADLLPESILRIRTPSSSDQLLKALGTQIMSMGCTPTTPLFIGTAGLVDGNEVVAAVNLPAPLPIRSALRSVSSMCHIVNDAQAQAVGLVEPGGSLLLLTIGTGVGGAICLDGKPIRGDRGFAGEFGHAATSASGDLCHCGLRGCLDTVTSGAALQRALGEGWWMNANPSSAGLLRDRLLFRAGSATASALAGWSRGLDISRVAVTGKVTAASSWRSGFASAFENGLFPKPRVEFHDDASRLVFVGLMRLSRSSDLSRP